MGSVLRNDQVLPEALAGFLRESLLYLSDAYWFKDQGAFLNGGVPLIQPAFALSRVHSEAHVKVTVRLWAWLTMTPVTVAQPLIEINRLGR